MRERVEGNVASGTIVSIMEAGEERGDGRELGFGSGVNDTDVNPQEMLWEADDEVDPEAFLLARAVGDNFSSASLTADAGGFIVLGRSVVDSGEKKSRDFETGRSGVFGEEDACDVTIEVAHHEVGGGVDVHKGTGLDGKRSDDLVEAFMGLMAKAEASRARDAVATIREEELCGGVPASTDVHEAWSGEPLDRGAPRTKEWE